MAETLSVALEVPEAMIDASSADMESLRGKRSSLLKQLKGKHNRIHLAVGRIASKTPSIEASIRERPRQSVSNMRGVTKCQHLVCFLGLAWGWDL